ncbi:TadE/TadG family type IV pilus assembly protein [Kitasatospora viridis]|nr:TadE/TadG family type IV pilus assembly protein [Kitasatospora viridis]
MPKRKPRAPDQGSATPELVLATPLLILLLMAFFQFALAAHAHHIAQAAAAQAVAAARTQDGDAATGRRAGEDLLAHVNSASLRDPSVSVSRSAGVARADVYGHVVRLLPGLDLVVRAHSSGPIEQLADG